jgi:hypothetical protein
MWPEERLQRGPWEVPSLLGESSEETSSLILWMFLNITPNDFWSHLPTTLKKAE